MKIMRRRDFLKATAVSLVVGDLVIAKEGIDTKSGEVGRVAEITQKSLPIDVEYDEEVVRFHPSEIEKVPVVKFNDQGQICNVVEELMQGTPVYEPTDMLGTVYSVWLNEEDYVVCSSPWAAIGTFWGLAHLEVKELSGDVWVATLHPTDKSIRHDVRSQTTIYANRKPLQ
jgi:hypothetical protein